MKRSYKDQAKIAQLKKDIAFYNEVRTDVHAAMGRLQRQSEEYAARIIALEVELEGLEQRYVKVVYLHPAQMSLRTPETFDYIDGTGGKIELGDRVIAPTRYNRRQQGIVVEVDTPLSYSGPLKTITEVLS